MKTTLFFLALLCGASAAEATVAICEGDQVITVEGAKVALNGVQLRVDGGYSRGTFKLGESCQVISGSIKVDGHGSTLRLNPTPPSAADTIKALKILLKHAPEKNESWAHVEGMTFTSRGYVTPRSKADALRDKAADTMAESARLCEEANKLDAEQAEIEWARGILRRWEESQ